MFDNIVQLVKNLYPGKDLVGLHEPVFKGNEKKYVEQCIDSTFVSSVGEFVGHFEKVTAEYTKIPFAVACVNGTSALHMALILSDVKEDDEVLTQALTFVATANAISYCNAHPIFVDSDIDRLGMCTSKLEDFLDRNAEVRDDGFCYNLVTGRRIKACVPMHVFGHPADMENIQRICRRFNISLVEDAAEALGSFYKGNHAGSYGDISILSYNGNKTVTTGGGGMILLSNETLARKAKHLTTTAKSPHKWNFVHDEIGYNYRMPNINAALGVAQMEYLTDILKNKRETAEAYQNFFKNTDFKFIQEPKDSKSNYWLNAILVKDRTERDELLNYTNSNGVMTRPIWELMNQLPAFKSAQTTDLTQARYLQDRLVNLPSGVRA